MTLSTAAQPVPSAQPARPAYCPTTDEVREYLPLVGQTVARFVRRLPRSVLREDLVAAGTCGLLDALRRHPEDRGVSFEWYARIRIRGAIMDELRTQDWLSRRARKAAQAEAGDKATCTSVVSFDDLAEGTRAASLVDGDAQSPLEAVLSHRSQRDMARAVQKLPAREQKIVTMHYFQDVQLKAIAHELGVSEPRVSQLHSRAMGMLKTLLASDLD